MSISNNCWCFFMPGGIRAIIQKREVSKLSAVQGAAEAAPEGVQCILHAFNRIIHKVGDFDCRGSTCDDAGRDRDDGSTVHRHL